MTIRKVQIFYASIGSGHRIAAQSISQAIKKINPNVEIELQDIFRSSKLNVLFQEILSFLPSFIFPELYTKIWKRGLFKWLYELSCSSGLIKRNIIKKIQSFSPDLLICTHTYPCTVISNWKQDHELPLLMAVATDQYIHPYWPVKNVDAIISPNLLMNQELMRRGFEKKRIYPFGIPVSPSLGEMSQKRKSNERIKVIVLAGSLRVAPYLIIRKRVNELLDYLEFHRSEKIIWQFVFGAAKGLKVRTQQRFINRKDVEIYEFPDCFQEMMANSDFIFTKPGGLSVAEALALKKPIVLLSSGAGQERENTNFVINTGAGILLNKTEDLMKFTQELLHKPSSAKKRFKRPSASLINSAQHVARLALRLMDES